MDGVSLLGWFIAVVIGVPALCAGVVKFVEIATNRWPTGPRPTPNVNRYEPAEGVRTFATLTIGAGGAGGSASSAMFAAPDLTWAKKAMKAGANVMQAIGAIVAFMLRYWQPVTLIAIVLIAWLVLRPVLGPAFHWVGATWGAMFPNEEEASARVDIRVAETETKIATQAIESAERTHIITREVVRIVEQADSEISNAVEDNDFAQLYRAYRDGYERVWDNGAGDAPPDPPQLRGLLALGSG